MQTEMTADLMPEADSLDELVATLRSLVASGGKLPAERKLAEQLRVKRHRLRQALHQLRADGHLGETAARRLPAARQGEALVRDTNPLEVIELRLMLEPALARHAAVRATPFDIGRIERAATTASDADSGEADLLFHKLIADGARNGLAAGFYALLRQIGRDTRIRVNAGRPVCPKRVLRRDAEHRAIAAAIQARDPEQAEAAMRQHLLQVQQTILEQLEPGRRVA